MALTNKHEYRWNKLKTTTYARWYEDVDGQCVSFFHIKYPHEHKERVGWSTIANNIQYYYWELLPRVTNVEAVEPYIDEMRAHYKETCKEMVEDSLKRAHGKGATV